MENKKKLKSLKKFWSRKKIFITGHTGFKGSWLCIILNLLKSKIYGYSLKPEKKSLFNESKISKFLESNTFSDVSNISLLNKKLKLAKPQIVFHLAAQSLVLKSYKFPVETFKTNIMGTVNLLNCIRKVNSIKSVIIVTTDKVYKIDKKNKIFNELDILGGSEPYSTSKVGAELATESFIKSFFNKTNLKNRISTARSGNVIGGGDYSKYRLVPDIIKAINNKKKIHVRNPDHVRPWQHVLDPLMGYLILAKQQYEGKIKKKNNCWNFGPKKNSFKKVINIVKKIRTFESFEYKIEKKQEKKETKILKLNSLKAKKILKWSSILDLNHSIKNTVEWNKLVKKGTSAKDVCEKQFLMYINKI